MMLSCMRLSDVNVSQIFEVLNFGFDPFSFSSWRDQCVFTCLHTALYVFE